MSTYRLILEYARVSSSQREDMGWVVELEKSVDVSRRCNYVPGSVYPRPRSFVSSKVPEISLQGVSFGTKTSLSTYVSHMA